MLGEAISLTKGKLYKLQAEHKNIPEECGWGNGELYRNLSDLLYYKEGADEGSSLQHGTKDILDEAKAEFPREMVVVEWAEPGSHLARQLYKEWVEAGRPEVDGKFGYLKYTKKRYNHYAIKAWFEKWFGRLKDDG